MGEAPKADPPALDRAPSVVETATLALGCFWGPDARFGSLPGVVRTRVGYCGGSTARPTYHDLADHAETVEVDFDPAVLSFRDLLEVFWGSHDPTGPSYARQYASLLFVHSEEQRRVAEASFRQERERRGAPLFTEILEAGPFHRAEDYHQKYFLRQQPLLVLDYARLYRDPRAFADSTSAARANGYAAGHGNPEQLERDLPAMRLSPRSEDLLRRLVASSASRSSSAG